MSDKEFEHLTLSEIYNKFRAVSLMMDYFPTQRNVYVYPRCIRYPDGDVKLTLRFSGHEEHIEHILVGWDLNERALPEPLPEIDKSEHGYRHENVSDAITKAMAEAIIGFELPLQEGVWVTNQETKIKAEFKEWSLGSEMQIVVIPEGSNTPKTWNLENVLKWS